MSSRIMSRFLSLCFLLCFVNFSSFANEVSKSKIKIIKECKAWKVIDNGDGSLSAVSFPTKQNGTYSKREQPYVAVTKFAGSSELEVSFHFGFTLKRGSEVPLTIHPNCNNTENSPVFYLTTQDQNSWARTDEDDVKIIKQFSGSCKAKVKANSTRNTYSEDEYSLSGFSDCIKLISTN